MNPVFSLFIKMTGKSPDAEYLRTIKHRLTWQTTLDYTEQFARQYDIRDTDTVVLNLEDPLLLCLFCWTALSRDANLVLLPLVGEEALEHYLPSHRQGIKLFTDMGKDRASPFRHFVHGLPVLQKKRRSERERFKVSGNKSISFFSGGTTGPRTMAPIRHIQVVWSIACILQEDIMPYTRGRTVFISPPLYHSYGFSTLMEYTFNGSRIVLSGKGRGLTGCFSTLADPDVGQEITNIEAVPYMHEQILLMMPRLMRWGLQHAGFGGDMVPEELLQKYRTIFPDISFSVRYGLSELPSVISLDRIGPGHALNPPVSTILPIYDVTIQQPPENSPFAPAEGEIVVRYKKEDLRRLGFSENIPEEALRTGDVGSMAGDRLVITGRIKQMGKIRGFAVSMPLLENVITRHPLVRDASVVLEQGKIRLLLVTEDDKKLSKEAIAAFIGKSLPDYYQPQAIQYVQEIPRTELGKKIRHFDK